MALTNTAIRNAKPTTKPYKLADEKGLFLLVQPSGGMLWRFKFRVDSYRISSAEAYERQAKHHSVNANCCRN